MSGVRGAVPSLPGSRGVSSLCPLGPLAVSPRCVPLGPLAVSPSAPGTSRDSRAVQPQPAQPGTRLDWTKPTPDPSALPRTWGLQYRPRCSTPQNSTCLLIFNPFLFCV